MRTPITSLLFLLLTLAGCEQINQSLGLEDPSKKEARQQADGRAVGGGCRQSGRAIEDCYSIYSWLPKAAIYEGWRDMDAYMRENDLQTVAPQLPPAEPPGAKKRKKPAVDEESNAPEAKSETKGSLGGIAAEKAAPTEKPAEKPGPETKNGAKH